MAKAMHKRNHRFELEVHVGLLCIIFVLFFLTFQANNVIHQARMRLYDKWSGTLATTALAVNRVATGYFPGTVPDSVVSILCRQYRLKDVAFIATRPADSSPESKRMWMASIITELPPGKIKSMADRIFGGELSVVTRGEGNEYFVMLPVPEGRGYPLMILAMDIPELAYLDDSSRTIFLLSVVSLLFVGGLYLYLSRFIFEPIRRLKDEARKAGRTIDGTVRFADAVVADYRNALDELSHSHEELLKFHAAISARANTLEQFNEHLLKSTESGVLSLDMSGSVLACNEAALRLLSIAPGSIVGQDYRRMLSADSIIRKLIETVYVQGIIPAYRETSTGDATVGVSMSFIRDADNKKVGLWLFLFDLTEITALRSQLETKNRLSALGEMAGGLAHQLRNSMGAISGYGALVKKRLTAAEAPIEQIDALLKESGQAEDMIRRFLNFSRPFDYAPIPTMIDSLVREIAESFQVRSDLPTVKMTIRCQSEGEVSADPLLFKQALGNLLENAARACSEADSSRSAGIVIETSRRPDGVMVTVTDGGPGIPSDKLEQVFTPFYSSRPGGTGLGLPLAARIIDLHGGRLTLSSRPGEGTQATIMLPSLSTRHSVRSAAATI